MNQKIFTVKIGGQAGQGIKSVGLLFAKSAVRSGYHIYDFTEYPSLIRGGHNVMQVSFSEEEVLGPAKNTDLLVAFNQETISKYSPEIMEGSGIVFDGDDDYDTSGVSKQANLYPIPLSKLAEEAGGKELLINTVAVGAVMSLLGGELQILKDLLTEEFSDKGLEIISINQKAAELGYNYAKMNFSDKIKRLLPVLNSLGTIATRMIINGNEAVALGAIAGGIQFAAIYPMSPASNILHVLAQYQEKFGYIYKQPEDEISALNMCIGASYAGARSFTSTSGGGFSLMVEAYGLAGMTETPVVIVDAMRGGPATGLPTWSEQGDLRFVLHAHQGDFPRIVLAAGDAKEAFELTMKAFNLADKYQTPVLLLIDKNICENDQSFMTFDTTNYQIDRGSFSRERINGYQRYSLQQKGGISLRSTPGTGNYFLSNSDEHDETGFSTEEIDMRNKQMQKRMSKLEQCEKEDMRGPLLYGPQDAKITVVSWGSNKGSILQAIKDYDQVNYLHFSWMNPFPSEKAKQILERSHYLLGVECNFTGQLMGIIREKTGIEVLDKLLKTDGRMIYPEEIKEKIDSVLERNKDL